MGTTQQFARLIGGSIAGINRIGQIAGLVFIIGTLLLWKHGSPVTRKLLACELVAVVLMLAAIVYVQKGIVPAMERDRASVGGDIAAVAPDNPARAHFDALHARSERIEGTALLLGIAVVLLMGGEDTRLALPATTR